MLEGRCLIQLDGICHSKVYNGIRSGNGDSARWTPTAGKKGSKAEETEDEGHPRRGVGLQMNEPTFLQRTSLKSTCFLSLLSVWMFVKCFFLPLPLLFYILPRICPDVGLFSLSLFKCG